jgi:asparagine synthase (glutamine-hydrolysing)
MCGITGIICGSLDRAVDEVALRAMTNAVSHRGPDGKGYYCDGPVGFGHRRLSVIDPAGGQQPMTDGSSARTLVYNGEIYNHGALRTQMEQSGVRFRTRSDTEVLLKLARFDGTDWLHALNGMYAFALWDPSLKTVLLGRDRLGVKPLYYAFHDGCLLFASEIKGILAYPGFPRQVNEQKIPEYLAFRSLAGSETFFRGIFMVPAGHLLRFELPDLRMTSHRFWWEGTFDAPGQSDARAPVDERFAALFGDAVEHRLVSDVPIGTFNSGGVDSSLVTQHVRARVAGELHTFSVGFDESAYDERTYAEMVAARLGTQHHALVMRSDEYADSLEETIWHMDEPLGHAHSVPLLKLSHFAKQFVTVVLTGEGADETFAGYPRHQVPLIARRLGKLGSALRLTARPLARAFGLRRLNKLLEVADSWQHSVVHGARFAPEPALSKVVGQTICCAERLQIMEEVFRQDQSFLESVLEYDRRTYLPGLLVRLDKTTMAGGVEARVPFLDYRMVQWSKSVSPRDKAVVGRSSKVMLKRIAAATFPEDMVYRRKAGFGVPVSDWLRDRRSLGRFADVLTDSTFRQRAYCETGLVKRLLADHMAGRADHGDILWPLLNVELWWRRYSSGGVLRPVSAEPPLQARARQSQGAA